MSRPKTTKFGKRQRIWMLVSTFILISVLLGWKGKQYLDDQTSDFIDVSIESRILGETRKVFIRLPSDYRPDVRYPLIIKTDGNYNLARWHEKLSLMEANSQFQGAILVAIPNQFWTNTRNRDLVPPYARKDVNIAPRPSSENAPELFGQADKFLAFIELELLPYLELHYRLSDSRLLSGFSAGGSFVLYTMVTKPSLFDGYFAFSPAAWYDDLVVVKEFANNIQHIEGKPRFFYLSIGSLENEIITGSFRGLIDTLEHRAPNNLVWQYQFTDGADHGVNPYYSVPNALDAYFSSR